MFGMYDLIIIFDKFGMVANALLPIVVTVSGIRIEVKLQPLNAFSPMVVTESGNVIEGKLIQFIKAALPIDVSEAGNVISVKLLQPPNA